MKITTGQINHVAKLARLSLSDSEIDEFSGQLSSIIEYVEKIKELDTASVEPAAHIADLKNVFRDDTVGASLSTDDIEKTAPDFENGYIVVPKIIE